MSAITAESLGSATFREDYRIRYAYLVGAMYKGIASPDMVIRLGEAGLLGFLGTGGMRLAEIEAAIQRIQARLTAGQAYGMNLLASPQRPELEAATVALFLQHHIQCVEAAAYVQITPALVQYRLHGVCRSATGAIHVPNAIIAKISRPEVAAAFMQPPPLSLVNTLVAAGLVTEEAAVLAPHIPMAHDICVESDSGGHTDQRVALTLVPTILLLRDDMMRRHCYAKTIRVGAAGGIGTPAAAAACFMLGADFILTGSINQCTVEAGNSSAVKILLQELEVQDTTYAPAGDMFELGARVQVVKKGLLFPARANKLYELYQFYQSIDAVDATMLQQIEERYFRRRIADVWDETKTYYQRERPEEIIKAEANPKHKLALIFRWYFIHTMRMALHGDTEQLADYQIHCGSALGAFNSWVKGTPLAAWQNRHVDVIANTIMQETAIYLSKQVDAWLANAAQIAK